MDKDDPIRIANFEGIPTPSQIREHAPDVGALIVRVERGDWYQEMAVINPVLAANEPKIMAELMAGIEAKIRDVIAAFDNPPPEPTDEA